MILSFLAALNLKIFLTNGSYDTTFNGEESDFFIIKLSGDGKTMQYSSFIGDRSREYSGGLEMDALGHPIIYVSLLQGLTLLQMETQTNELNHLLTIEEQISELKINNNNNLFLLRKGDFDIVQFPVRYHLDLNGTVVEELNEQNGSIDISPPYPNPFNSSTMIEFTLSQHSYTTVRIYNINGQLVEELISEYMTAGRHVFHWTANNIASGLYYCEIESNNINKISKMMLLR